MFGHAKVNYTCAETFGRMSLHAGQFVWTTAVWTPGLCISKELIRVLWASEVHTAAWKKNRLIMIVKEYNLQACTVKKRTVPSTDPWETPVKGFMVLAITNKWRHIVDESVGKQYNHKRSRKEVMAWTQVHRHHLG